MVSGVHDNLQLVEMCSSEGVWSPVCDNNWTVQDATVVCRELGYTSSGIYRVIVTPPTVKWTVVITINTTFRGDEDIAFSWRFSSYCRDTRLHWN